MMKPLVRDSRTKAKKKAGEKKVKLSKMAIGGIIIAIIAGGTLAGILLYWYLPGGPGNPGTITPGTGTGVFDVVVMDGYLGVEIPADECPYTLWGTNDSTDWTEFDEIDDGTGLDDLKASDIDESEYLYYFVNYTGTITHDDDIYDLDQGNRLYGERWQRVYNDRTNTFTTYQSPEPVTVFAYYSANWTVVDLTTWNVTEGNNITIFAAINGSQAEAMFMPYFDYEAQETISFTIVVYGDAAFVKNDFKINGEPGEFPNPANKTYIEYTIGSLSPGITSFEGLWIDATPSGAVHAITKIELYWGETLEDSIA